MRFNMQKKPRNHAVIIASSCVLCSKLRILRATPRDDREKFQREEREARMNKHIIDSLRRAYDAFSRGDIQGAVEALDLAQIFSGASPKAFMREEPIRGLKESP